MWCGVVWCGVVWWSMVWCGVVCWSVFFDIFILSLLNLLEISDKMIIPLDFVNI